MECLHIASFVVHQVSTKDSWWYISGLVGATKQISSAKNKAFGIWVESDPLRDSARGSMNRLNSQGDRRDPCSNPRKRGRGGVNV